MSPSPSDARVVFAANARAGVGGQGEFLRLMTHALARRGARTIYSRDNVPFSGTARSAAFGLVRGLPIVRRRVDWLTLLADEDFDARVADLIDPPALFDGITGQCRDTLQRLAGTPARMVVTCLNTHVNHLVREMGQEAERAGFTGRTFVHPRMRARALEEIRAAHHLRVNSQLAKQTFVDEGIDPSRVSVVYPGIDLGHFQPAAKRDDVFRVLVVSSIDLRKGVRYALEAFEQARLPNAELVLIGGTGDRWSKDLLAAYRRRHSNLAVRSVDVMSASADTTFGPASVLVHAAVEDGYGLVIPQALACGRPVIATGSSGAAELVRHGETGFVVDARSVPQLVDALRTLAGDRDLWAGMCARARATVAHLSYDNFAKEVAELYLRILNSEF